jgi:hypothetical protein
MHRHGDEVVVAPPELLMLEDSASLSGTEESELSKDVQCWDEDEYGDQAYNDQTCVMNEDLVPWNETGDGAEEYWGLWVVNCSALFQVLQPSLTELCSMRLRGRRPRG